MNVGVVIPVGAGRIENLKRLLRDLNDQMPFGPICSCVLVFDGEDAKAEADEAIGEYGQLTVVTIPKHKPGMEQPRNVGVRMLEQINQLESDEDKRMSHVWFLDSDLTMEPDCLAQFVKVHEAVTPYAKNAIIVGPYDWLPPEFTERLPSLRNDPRWPSFDEHDGKVVREDLSAGLACFSGNLIWPISEFTRVGGFWNELHHGRCEDGELGLRAVACGIPIAFAAGARAWHVDHPRNMDWILSANARDVSMLNARHPWVKDAGMFVVEQDGKRFDVNCRCGWTGNTALIWEHELNCPLGHVIKVPA